MRIAIAYVFPAIQLPTYVPLAQRFVSSYIDHPPGETDHDVFVVVNGDSTGINLQAIFAPLPVRFLKHNNYGKDLGAYFVAASQIPCDLLVCFGSPVYFHRAAWLDRIARVYSEGGPGLYGCWGFGQPNPHIRTTAFWLPPELLLSYPHPVGNADRYAFEHDRERSILRHAVDLGYVSAMVDWKRVSAYPNFVHVEKQDCLVWDQHVDRNFK